MSATTQRLNDGYARLIRILRMKPDGPGARPRVAAITAAAGMLKDRGAASVQALRARLPRRREPAAADAQARGAPTPARIRQPAGPPVEPRELPSILRRTTRDSRVVIGVAALVVVLVTTLVIAVPASLDRMALQRRIAGLDADLAAQRSRIEAMIARDADRGRFVRDFSARFMDPQVYKAAAARTAAFKPDGLDDGGALIRSMLWQLKSHRGTAHFLAARKSVRLTVNLSGALPKVEWRELDSPLPALLGKLGIKPTDRAVRALNIQINRFGFTTVNDAAVIARDVDGKLVIVKLK